MTKSSERVSKKIADNAIMTYVETERTLTWAIAEVRYSSIRGLALAEIFDRSKRTYGETVRYKEIYSACKVMRWL
jgi:hypothetical protein